MSEKPRAVFRHIPITSLSGDDLLALSKRMKLSLSKEDMLAVQAIFKEENREPTDVELEVIAQTWSEHCKHRIFGARIEHTVDGSDGSGVRGLARLEHEVGPDSCGLFAETAHHARRVRGVPVEHGLR